MSLAESIASIPAGSVTREYISAFVQLFDPLDQPSTDRLRALAESSSRSMSENVRQRRLQIILKAMMEVIEPFRIEAHRFLKDCPQPQRTKPRAIARFTEFQLGLDDASIVVEAWVCAVRKVDPPDHWPLSEPPPPGSPGTLCIEMAHEIQQRRRRYKPMAKLPGFDEQADAVAQMVLSIGALSLAADFGSARYAVESLLNIETLLPAGRATATKIAIDIVDELRTA